MAAVGSAPTVADLRPLLRRGLPVDGSAIGEPLLALAGVVARASQTADRASLVAAFDGLVRGLLARFADHRLAEAARALFGVSPGLAGVTLTARREAAARACGREVHHFRKHIEPRILAELARALAADSDRLATSRTAAPRLVPVVRQPAGLPEDMFAWEAVEHEEQIARLWSGVYALRADLLACERLSSMDPAGSEVIAAAEMALWRAGQLHVAVREYRRAYGARLLHGDIAPDALLGLAGWVPPLDPSEVDVVCHCAPDATDLGPFLAHLACVARGADIHAYWVAALAAPEPTARSSA